jgi:guanyl-specific ribonuclease Sa
VDPLVNVTGQPYAYTGDDPVNGVDPFGQSLIPSWVSSEVHSVGSGITSVAECLGNLECLSSPEGLANAGAGFADQAAQVLDGLICNGTAELTCPTWRVGVPYPCGPQGSYQVGEAAFLGLGFLAPGGEESDIATDLTPAVEAGSQIPQNAQEVLEYIEAHNGQSPPGYVGGGTFYNNEGLLPSDASGNAITYREYDVNPYQKGVNRGSERIVVGSNGSAYYTNDHYESFTPIP